MKKMRKRAFLKNKYKKFFYNSVDFKGGIKVNITTIIELENLEVEKLAGAKLVFSQEHIDENIVETCVECFQSEITREKISTEEAMEIVFNGLKQEGVIPNQVEDFSFEMPSCGSMIKKSQTESDLPQKVILTYNR